MRPRANRDMKHPKPALNRRAAKTASSTSAAPSPAKSTTGRVKIGLVQMTCSSDPAENMAKALARINEAADRGAEIICTQELFRSQYFCQAEDHNNFALAEPIPGPSTEAFQKLARQRRVTIIASLFERRAPGL